MKDKQPQKSAKISVAASIQANIEPRRFRELRETLAQTPVNTTDQSQPETSVPPCGPETPEFKEELAAPELDLQHA